MSSWVLSFVVSVIDFFFSYHIQRVFYGYFTSRYYFLRWTLSEILRTMSVFIKLEVNCLKSNFQMKYKTKDIYISSQDFRNYVSSANQCQCLWNVIVFYCQRVNLKIDLGGHWDLIFAKKKMNYLIYNLLAWSWH